MWNQWKFQNAILRLSDCRRRVTLQLTRNGCVSSKLSWGGTECRLVMTGDNHFGLLDLTYVESFLYKFVVCVVPESVLHRTQMLWSETHICTHNFSLANPLCKTLIVVIVDTSCGILTECASDRRDQEPPLVMAGRTNVCSAPCNLHDYYEEWCVVGHIPTSYYFLTVPESLSCQLLAVRSSQCCPPS